MLKRKATVLVYDARAGRKVNHKKVKYVKNHNEESVFPLHDKVIQGRGESNCVALALASCCKMLKQLRGEELGEAMAQQLVDDAENFHEMVKDAAEPFREEKGYTNAHLLFFVRHISSVLKPAGLYLKCVSRRQWTHRSFLGLTANQRAGRVFLLFGWYPSSTKNNEMQKKIKEAMESPRTAHRLYEPMQARYWQPKNEFSLHAISLLYDQNGRGTVDDPAHQIYHPLTPPHLFKSCACICSVYELSIDAV